MANNLAYLDTATIIAVKSFIVQASNYKYIMIVNYDSSVVNKFGASLTDNARVVIYDCHMFIVQATDLSTFKALPGKVGS
jgi:hypothetical protein